jgi:NADH-quinone oxidoreductase subunit L
MLAYSTLSQIALMLSALAVAPASVGAGPGVLHMLSHAMFKALLFLAIGWLSVLVAGTAAATMSGGVRHHPQLRLPIAIGLLSLAGVPPLVGFVSKEYVLGAAYDNVTELGSVAGWVVLVAFVVTVVLTAAYCTRAWLVLTHLSPEEQAIRQARIKESRTVVDVSIVEILTQPASVPPDTAPDTASGPVGGSTPAAVAAEPDHGHAGIFGSARASVGVLAFLSVFGGLIVFTPLVGVKPHLVWFLAAGSLLLILGAWVVVGRLASRNGSGDAAELLGARRTALFDKGFGADGIYVAVVSPVVRMARVVVTADREVIDAYVRGTVVVTRWAGIAGERAHTRKPSSYLVWLLLGLLAVGVSGVTLW